METKSLYVTVTADCEDLANAIFPRGSEWVFNSEDEQDDGNLVIAYEWNGEFETAIKKNLSAHPQVISYQIL
jgi:hypothetical protein